MDWSACADVESTLGVVSGAFVLRGTRVQADAILSNAADGYTAEQIAKDIFDELPVEALRRVIEFGAARGFHTA